jgi:hypothetical protein
MESGYANGPDHPDWAVARRFLAMPRRGYWLHNSSPRRPMLPRAITRRVIGPTTE